MKFIPLIGKRQFLTTGTYWNGKPGRIKNQTAIGILNGKDGLTCLDIDFPDVQACDEYLKRIRSIFLTHQFGLVHTHSSKYHIYFRYFGPTHKSVQFLETQEGIHFGELRCSRYQVFPSEEPKYTWSNKYELIQGLDNLPVLDDADIDYLMKELDITFVARKTKPAEETSTRSKSIEREEEERTNDCATLLEGDSSLESYLPTTWDTNCPKMLSLLRVLYRQERYADCDTYFAKWLSLNQFKRHSDDNYYWQKWEGIKKGFNPSKLRPFELFSDVVARSLQEASSNGLKTRQKQITYAVERLIPRLKDEYGLFHLGSHTKFFTENNIHPEEVLRAMRLLIKQGKVRLVDRGWVGRSSKKANTYEVIHTHKAATQAPDTLGSSQDVFGAIQMAEEDTDTTILVGRRLE
jgi:hypothetical protein